MIFSNIMIKKSFLFTIHCLLLWKGAFNNYKHEN